MSTLGSRECVFQVVNFDNGYQAVRANARSVLELTSLRLISTRWKDLVVLSCNNFLYHYLVLF
jgi:hypothetical protein